MFLRAASAILMATAILCPAALHAEHDLGAEAALFTRPLAVKTVPPKSSNDEIGELMCTYYPDVMVRETGTDSPAPGAATIIPLADAAHRPGCNTAHVAREVPLKTEGFFLLGRKGPFLFFEAADPYGAVPFSILDASTGRAVFTDGKKDEGLHTVALDGGTLRIRFTRSVNGSCSIPQDAPGCWAKMAQEGKIPPRLAQSAPPVQACAASYGKEKAPADGPSVIYYDVDMTVDRSGKTTINSLGTVFCEPLP